MNVTLKKTQSAIFMATVFLVVVQYIALVSKKAELTNAIFFLNIVYDMSNL